MRLLLDTTYFLPTIGILVKGIPQKAVLEILDKGHEVSLSDITVFELSAKGGKYVADGRISPERVSRGISSIVHNEKLEKIPYHETSLLLTAFNLRVYLNDFIDCLILSSAINHCEVLITEDWDVLKLAEQKRFLDLLTTINPSFKMYKITEIQ